MNSLLLALAIFTQDTVKTRVSSDTTDFPSDSSMVVDTTGWRFIDSIPLLDTTWSHTIGRVRIDEDWEYIISILAGDEDSIPVIPPPSGSVIWDFNDPNNLGLQKSLPNKNKQFWDATGGTNSDGAIRVDYWTGMPIGWTQLNLNELPASHYWTLAMWAKIVDSDGAPHTMEHEGSSIKLIRSCNNPTCPGKSSNPPGRIGTWEYHLRSNPQPVCRFIPDHWSPSGTQSKYCPGQMPTDGLWHEWEIEFDSRDLTKIRQIFRIDGIEIGRMQYKNQDPQLRDLTGPLNISPFVDMYSCGQTPPNGNCAASVNTGSVYFDDFVWVKLD